MKAYTKIAVSLTLFYLLSGSFSAFGQAVGDYRSFASGTWATAANWQRFDGTSWINPAPTPPTSASGVITIQSGHTMNIAANVTIDQVVINTGGTINWTLGTCTIANGAGVDLLIDGTFWDNRGVATTSITFNASATWQMGAAGTLVRSAGNSSNNWQASYEGGISLIPSTAFWILRKTGTQSPVLSTTVPATGSVYPNLILENNTATAWTSASFTGTTAYPTIKGYLDIGGSGTGTGAITLLNSNTFATPMTVQGNMLVRTGHIYQNYGTGADIAGDLTVNGTITYAAGTGSRKLIFSGSSAQSIAGTGSLGIYAMTMNKAAGALTLNRAITVDNVLTFTSGLINTSSANLLTISSTGTVTGASNASFVSGPVRYTGSPAFTYPVGKGSDYQPLSISAGSGGAGGTFWTETFDGSSCAATSGCDPSLVAWTVTNTGTNGANANRFYVSCQENGNAAGACGSGCGTDQSLHVGNVSTSAAAAFFCPSGDCGAAYDDSGAAEATNKRAESPTINCTGYSNITVSFNYFETGEGADDNASLMYFNGTAWSILDALAKSNNTGCSGQGRWTAFSVALPASANGNPNVKIGFNWSNDGDGVATDPSFAVDDITLSVAAAVNDFTCEYFYENPQIAFNNSLVAGINHIDSCEYWTLTRNAGTENKNITLSWDANSCGITALADLRVAHWDGTTWQNEGNTATTGTMSAGTVTSGTVTWFSPFTISSISPVIPLPIELLSFTANYNGSGVDLLWQTATEVNNDYFTLERSAEAVEFTAIGTVPGAGNSDHTISYAGLDPYPLHGISYYRLKQTDYDGTMTYSQIVPVEIDNNDFVIVNAYASEEVLEVTVNCSGPCTVNYELYDSQGKKVFSAEKDGDGEKLLIPVSSLQEGIYLLRAYDGRKVVVKKLKL